MATALSELADDCADLDLLLLFEPGNELPEWATFIYRHLENRYHVYNYGEI